VSEAFIPGFGASLAAAREAMGLSAADVADRLKLTARQIEALEAEDWSHLPDPVFVRGFVRNYARLVELDPDSLVNPVPAVETTTKAITAPSAGLRLDKSPFTHWLLLPLLLLALFLAVVAGLYAWLSQGEDTMLPTPVAEPPAAKSPAAASAPAAETVIKPVPVEPRATETPAAEVATPVQGVVEMIQPTPVTIPADQAPSEAAKPAGVSMRFEPEIDAWIQVVDGKGARHSRLVRAGTSEVITGTPPFRLVVGNAAEVKLTYNGHVIDLKPFIGEKVARLTLE
jgi:cytoskeleton protein RodZ